MTGISALQSAVTGIQRGVDGLNRDANTIARASVTESVSSPEVLNALVNLQEDKLQVQASAKVVAAADETIGSLLDVIA